jgi:hypothetical protein
MLLNKFFLADLLFFSVIYDGFKVQKIAQLKYMVNTLILRL